MGRQTNEITQRYDAAAMAQQARGRVPRNSAPHQYRNLSAIGALVTPAQTLGTHSPPLHSVSNQCRRAALNKRKRSCVS